MRILNEDTEISVRNDKILQEVQETKESIHREVVDIATKLHEVYEAERQFSKHMDDLVIKHYGTEEEQIKQKQEPSQFKKPVKKTIAFGKISLVKKK